MVERAVRNDTLRGRIVEVTGPENLTFIELADPLIVAAGLPGRVSRVVPAMVRAMSVLASPASPASARLARAAVVMNTTAMTSAGAGFRHPAPTTTLDDVLDRRRTELRYPPWPAGRSRPSGRVSVDR